MPYVISIFTGLDEMCVCVCMCLLADEISKACHATACRAVGKMGKPRALAERERTKERKRAKYKSMHERNQSIPLTTSNLKYNSVKSIHTGHTSARIHDFYSISGFCFAPTKLPRCSMYLVSIRFDKIKCISGGARESSAFVGKTKG